MENKQKLFNGILVRFQKELDARGYTLGVIQGYVKFARMFIAWCIEGEYGALTMKMCEDYLDQKLGQHIFSGDLSIPERSEIRAVRMLVTLELDGDFEYRTPKKDRTVKRLGSENLTGFLTYCGESLHLAASTRAGYSLTLYKFDGYLDKSGLDVGKVTTGDFEAFFSSEAISPKGRKPAKAVLKSFYSWMYDTGRTDVDRSSFILKEPNVQTGEAIPTTYTEEEIRSMLGAVNRATAKGKRDYLVIALAAQYGWRAGDIIGFKFSHIDWEGNRIRFSQQKTGNPVEYPLMPSIGNAIIDYLKGGRPKSSHPNIILSHSNQTMGKPLTAPTLHSIVTKALKDAKVNIRGKKHGPHSLRFSLATNALRKEFDLSIIGSILGHKVPDTTMDYLRVNVEDLRRCALDIIPCRNLIYVKEWREA